MANVNDPNFSRDQSALTACSFPNRNSERVQKYNLRDSYRIVSWVYACVNVIAESISGVPFKFYNRPPGTEDKSEIPESHPANKLFTPPKPMEIITREDYIKAIFANLGVFGEVFSPFGFEGKGATKIPTDIDVKAPQYFQANRNDVGDLVSWQWQRFGKDGKQLPPVTLADGEVLQFKYYDPQSPIRGLTPLAPGRLSIEQEINMSVWNAGFFQGGLRNPIVILLKHMLGTGTNRTNFLKQIQNDYSGFVRGQGPLVLEGGADARPLLQSIKDLDFIEGKNLTREEICALYGVPPALVGIFRYANYANSREQTRLFWINTLVPKMRLFRNVIQVGLLSKYWPDVYCDFDWDSVDAIAADPVQKATKHNLTSSAASNLYNMNYTKEEIALILDDDKYVGDGEAKPPPAPVAGPKQPGPGNGGGSNNKPKPAMPAGRPSKKPKLYECIKIVRSADEEVITWDLNSEMLAAAAESYQVHSLNPLAAEYNRFVKTFAKQVLEEALSLRGELPDPVKWQKQWEDAVKPGLRAILYAGVEQAWLEATTADETLDFIPIPKRKELIAHDNPEKSLDFFAKETSEKSFIVTGVIGGMLQSPSANKLVETPDAIILPLMNMQEAKWVVSRIFHHGKMLAQAALGVSKHMWAAHDCPQGHDGLSGTIVAHWADFPQGIGIHPVAKEHQAPVQACTCTTCPAEVVVKLSVTRR